MKYIKAFSSLSLLIVLIFLLNHQWGSLPPLANFISPFTGFWQNAESTGKIRNETIALKGLKDKVSIVYDEHMIPHIFAKNEHDLYVAQGYVTARFRLWQMEIQTRAAAGRLSEIAGDKTLEIDRYARRTGMVYGAEKLLDMMKKNPEVDDLLNAYADGVNDYIASLDNASLPIEYKLLNYTPEKWSPLKTGLLLKKMAENLTAMEHDIEHSNALESFGESSFHLLYPDYWSEQQPIIPVGTLFPFRNNVMQESLKIIAKSIIQSGESKVNNNSFFDTDPEKDYLLGSNNWALSGSKTKSGRPILCNDPHLKLSLPSIWFQIHLNCPFYNVCGASLPGAPGVISGFNDSIAWGVTNAGRDVRDWYQVQFKDESHNEYLLDDQWMPVRKVIEKFLVKGGKPFYDTVLYVHQGPVVYDRNFNQNNRTNLALRWTAHDESEEMITFNKLNKAKNINDYFEAISHYSCPAQNFVFAAKNGDIAIQQQGKFPIEKKDQAIFIQDGTKSENDLITYIPFSDNPHIVNPLRGFVSSANQHPTDTTYPYPYAGVFEAFRNRRINDYLSHLTHATMSDMEKMQHDNFNVLAKELLPQMLRYMQPEMKSPEEQKVYTQLTDWNYYNEAGMIAPAYFEIWKDTLKTLLWDEMYTSKIPLRVPDDIVMVHLLNHPMDNIFFDIKSTSKKESLQDLMLLSFQSACKKIALMKAKNWSEYKNTEIEFLIPTIPAFGRKYVYCGGNKQIINATARHYGPSWRMIVEMTDDIHAEAIYPAGQSGNPGSRYFDDMILDWAAGKYYEVWHSAQIKDIKKHEKFSIQLVPDED